MDATVGPVDLAVPAGRTLALIGPSGAGKSTVLRLMLGLIRPDEGEVRLGGIPLEPVVHTAESSAEPTTVSAESPEFVTREEYIASTYQLVQVLTNQLNDYDQRRTGEMALMMRGLQNTLEQRQERDREEMNARMEQFWLRAAGVRSLEGEESSPADSTGR